MKARSGIRDNRSRGAVHEFIGERAVPGSRLSVVSAYFTTFAYGHLRTTLDSVGQMRFLFGEPRFLSALAIATYLAGRLACVPEGDGALKLLVLDDLLLSLDHSHRRPVLDVITELFKGWQIVLLTHDRFWFELAREQLSGEPWKAIEIYEKLDADGLLRPVIWESQEDLVAETLKQAGRFLDDNHPAAAANYARTACELTLRRYCRRHNVQFGYTDDPQKIKLEALLQKGEAHANGSAGRKAAFEALKKYKKLILNPLSHNPTQPIVKADVAAAIQAVKNLVTACGKPTAQSPD